LWRFRWQFLTRDLLADVQNHRCLPRLHGSHPPTRQDRTLAFGAGRPSFGLCM
jgi:hypothetical protein